MHGDQCVAYLRLYPPGWKLNPPSRAGKAADGSEKLPGLYISDWLRRKRGNHFFASEHGSWEGGSLDKEKLGPDHWEQKWDVTTPSLGASAARYVTLHGIHRPNVVPHPPARQRLDESQGQSQQEKKAKEVDVCRSRRLALCGHSPFASSRPRGISISLFMNIDEHRSSEVLPCPFGVQ